MKGKLETPMGELLVLLNGKEIEYTYNKIEEREILNSRSFLRSFQGFQSFLLSENLGKNRKN